MKKKISIILVVVLLMATMLSGCGSSSSDEGVTTLNIATGGTSGTYYGFCGIIASTFNSHLSDVMTVNVESTGASMANVQLLQAGENNIAIIQNDVMYYAYTGTDLWAASGADAYTDFSAVMACYPETIQIIANSSITSIEDLVGKKVSVGDAGSGVEFNATQILAAYGIDIDSDIVKNNQSFADSADSLKNGTIDAAFVVAGAPTVAVTELAATYDFNILEIDAEHAAALMAEYEFYTTITIPADTYAPQTEDVQTVAVMATLVARNDVDEDVIYAFVEGMFEYKDEIAAGHEKGLLIDLETAVSGISIPFHSGAQKYFEEQGVL